jgi:hypothetical protein
VVQFRPVSCEEQNDEAIQTIEGIRRGIAASLALLAMTVSFRGVGPGRCGTRTSWAGLYGPMLGAVGISSAVGALLPRANSSLARFASSCFQLLIIVGWTPNSDDSSARVFSPDGACLEVRAVLLPLYTHVSRLFGPVSP